MAEAFTIRAATADDVTGILHCLSAAFAPFQSQYTPAAYADTILDPERLRERMQTQTVFVAVDQSANVIGTVGGKVIGSEHRGHIRGMAVLPEWHGRGVAEALLHRVEDELKTRGCQRVTLNTTGPLRRAIHFYERRGYVATGKIG